MLLPTGERDFAHQANMIEREQGRLYWIPWNRLVFVSHRWVMDLWQQKSRLFVEKQKKTDPFSKGKVTPCSTPQRWLCGTPEVGSRHFFGGNRVGLKGKTPWEPEISEIGQVDDIPMIPHICLPMSHAYVGCLMTTVEMIDVWWMTQVVISSGWKSW